MADHFKNAYVALTARFENRVAAMFHRISVFSNYTVTRESITMDFYPDGFFRFVKVTFCRSSFEFTYSVFLRDQRIPARHSAEPALSPAFLASLGSLEMAVETCLALECLGECPRKGYLELAF